MIASSEGRRIRRRAGQRPEGSRADIQALRALAVSIVVVYHLAPHRLTGGFVGVDVFFVISGFLITLHLLQHPPRHIGDFLQFWSRRIRRLLPASLLTLLVTLVATRVVASDALWHDTATQVRAASLYFVNWLLAGQQVDYLHPAVPPSPVQHFWSLSVEEQFYLGWPLLLAALCALAAIAKRRTSVVVAGVALVVATSLAWSVHLTSTDPTSAYFATTTRMWELGAGGLVAALAIGLPREGRAAARRRSAPVLWIRMATAWLGLVIIGATAFGYDDATPFPGWQAGVPVLGAVLVIAANAPARSWSPVGLMRLRPVQWLGDVSYSVYLWHWPLIILVPQVTHGGRGRLDDLAIVAATLVLATLTKRFVEDRFRTRRRNASLLRPFAYAAAAMAVVLVAAQLQVHEIDSRRRVDKAAALLAVSSDPCYGAAAIKAPAGRCTVATASGRLLPTPLEAREEQSDAWHDQGDGDNCLSSPPEYPVRVCHFGSSDGRTKVALVGNSHGAEWLPALRDIADANHWSVTTYLAAGCASAATSQVIDDDQSRHSCDRWVGDVVDQARAGHFDLIVMSNTESGKAYGTQTAAANSGAYERGYRSVLDRLSAAGQRVLIIRDTPIPGINITTCLGEHPDDFTACSGLRKKWLRRTDDTLPAAREVGRSNVSTVNMTRYICPTHRCPAVIGTVPVYFDTSHLTSAYAHTLAPYLQPAVLRALKSPK